MTTHTKEELLPCPFCGSEARLCRVSKSEYFVTCSECEIQYPSNNNFYFTSEQSAIERWNTRATPKPVEPDRDEVVKAMVFEVIDPKAIGTSWMGHYQDIAKKMLSAIELRYRLVPKEADHG